MTAENETGAENSSDTEPTAHPPKPRSRARGILSHPLAHLVMAFLVLSLVQGFLVKVYTVPSGSMEQTLKVGDRILVNRLAFLNAEPAVGDVVVFRTPDDWHGGPTVVIDSPLEWVVRAFGEVTGIGPAMHTSMVKRIVATPGQVVGCCGPGGQITVDAVAVEVPETGNSFTGGQTADCASGETLAGCFASFVVPEGEYVLLGDNRPGSSDSMSGCYAVTDGSSGADCVRTAHRNDLVGVVFAVVFPGTRAVV